MKLDNFAEHPINNLDQEFREISDDVCRLASNYSLKLVGYHSPELHLWSGLPQYQQEKVLRHLRVFHQTMKTMEASGERLDNSERSAWHAMVSMGLIPPSELFSKFSSEDIIEILDLEGVQIWRNFNFLKICSYTIEEMYCLDWKARYTREEAKTAECQQKVFALLSYQTPSVHYAGVDEHVIKETASIDRLTLNVRHDYIARLTNQKGELSAWVVTSRVQVLGKEWKVPKHRPLSAPGTSPSLNS